MFLGLIKKVVLPPRTKIVRVCFPANLHMLLQYLLITEESDYDKTFFFVHDQIQQPIKEKMHCRCEFNYGRVMPGWEKSLFNVLFWMLKILLLRIFPFIKDAELYIGDHLVMGWILGCRHKYYLLEDGEGNYRGLTPLQHMGRLRYLMSAILFSPFPMGYWGRTKQCLGRLLTRPVSPGFDHSDVPVFYVNMGELWETASEVKKARVMDYFGVNMDMLRAFDGRSVLILTQPFSEDGMCTEAEKVMCYKRIIAQYDLTQVVLKPHPRENTNYRDVLDKRVVVVDRSVPMELFSYLGASFREVVAISSTAASHFADRATVRVLGNGEIQSLCKFRK